ncbi:MAG: glycosyltransferase family 1 protein [Thermoleophilaceae bacterium]
MFPRRVGGTETYARALLAEYTRGNGPERVTVLANRHVAAEYGHATSDSVALHHVHSYRSGERMTTRALAMAWARMAPRRVARNVPDDIDVLHLPVTVPIPKLDRPTVVTIHELFYYELSREHLSTPQRWYRRWAYDGSARNATIVVAISSYVADRLAEYSGINRDRIEVVPYGVEHDRFRPQSEPGDAARLKSLELPERFLLYPATFMPYKNHARLLEALASVPDRTLALVLAGQDYGRLPQLQEHAHTLGVADRVRHVSHVEPATLAALYRRAEATVFPSLAEGFGLPPLEAMACGCPVASAKNTSLAEVCGDAALELEPENPTQMTASITQITEDQLLRANLRERGLKRAKRFSWATAAERHVEIYRRAAAT